MASEIPASVMETAKSIARRREWVHEAIAEAILAERERCRLIAAGFDDGEDSGFSQAARTIERIIRQDNPNETEQANG